MRTYSKNLEDAKKTQRMRDGNGYDRYYRDTRSIINWSYLSNYLKSKVGEKWDDIWAEVCSFNDNRNFNESEFRDGIKRKVYFNVTIENDEILVNDSKISWWLGYRGGYYVDPNTGLLCYLHKSKKVRRSQPDSKIVRLNGLEYYNHEGIWYEVVTEPTKKWSSSWFGDYYYDVFGFHVGSSRKTYNEDVVITKKKQCGKKAIKKINKHLESFAHEVD